MLTGASSGWSGRGWYSTGLAKERKKKEKKRNMAQKRHRVSYSAKFRLVKDRQLEFSANQKSVMKTKTAFVFKAIFFSFSDCGLKFFVCLFVCLFYSSV